VFLEKGGETRLLNFGVVTSRRKGGREKIQKWREDDIVRQGAFGSSRGATKRGWGGSRDGARVKKQEILG